MSIVLLVEDEPLVALMLLDALSEAGHSTAWASSAEHALELLEQIVDGLSALITDIDLSSGLCGFDLANRARGLRPELPVIYATGRSRAEVARRGVPGSELIGKPFEPLQVIQMLRRVTECRQSIRSTCALTSGLDCVCG